MEGVIFIGRLLGTGIELLTGEGSGGRPTGDNNICEGKGEVLAEDCNATILSVAALALVEEEQLELVSTANKYVYR